MTHSLPIRWACQPRDGLCARPIPWEDDLKHVHRRALSQRGREAGQGMVEYALILVLIAVVVIVVLIVLGNQVQNVFCNISGGLGQ